MSELLHNYYKLGALQALKDSGELKKVAATLNPEEFTFLERLLGKNVRDVSARELNRIMSSGEIGAIRQGSPENMSTVQEHIRGLLHGKETDIPLVRELVQNRDLSKQVDIIDSIREGQRAVSAERLAARNARLITAGVGVGTPLALSKANVKLRDEVKEKAPAIAGTAVAATPVIQGLRSGAIRVPSSLNEITGRQAIGDAQELATKIQRGDIILTGDPVMHGGKAWIIASGADPHSYHAAVATGPVENGRLNVVHSGGDIGSATHGSYPVGDRDIVIRRLKNQEHIDAMMKNIDSMATKEHVLDSIFGGTSRQSTYDMGGAVKSSLKDLLPESLRKALGTSVKPGGAFCSSLVGGSCPVPIKPGVPGNEILPHHILSSEALHDVGHFYPKRPTSIALREGALRAIPLALRGAVGLGLGYGAYKGLKALTDKTPKPIKDIKSWVS